MQLIQKCRIVVSRVTESSFGARIVLLAVLGWLTVIVGCGLHSVEYAEIHDAAGAGDPTAVQGFLRRGADINDLDGYGETALHSAIKYNKKNTAALLLREGADVNIGTARGGDTPLHYAVWGQNWDIVKLLLMNGANENKRNVDGESPREYVVKQGIMEHYEAVAQSTKPDEEPKL